MGTLSYGQHILKGKISFEEGEAATGAIVRALKTDTASMLDYTLTDENGNWQLPIQYQDSILLEFSLFGYETKYEIVPSPQKVVQPFDITLRQKSFDLAAVTVKEKDLGVSRDGDTLTFRLRTFTTGAERTLGDVLKRLPGMEIRDGAVYYGGEKITKMLVQGRDIINANQQLATEGIRADQLQEIKVIENYKEPSQQFETEQTEDVAMDVRLKEDQLNKWSGELEVLGGYPASGKGDLNTFNLNDKVGLSGFARANNVGERVLTFRDMMNMMSDQGSRRFYFRGSDFISLIPSELNISDRVQANLDGIINFNVDLDATKDMKIKGFVMGAYAERESEVYSETDFLSENQSRVEIMNRMTQTPIVNSMWKMEWNADSSTFIEIGLPATLNFSTVDENRDGQFNNISFNTRLEEEEWNFNFSPFAKMRKKVGKDDRWNVDTRYQKSRQSGDLLYTDRFPFLKIPLNPDDSLYSILQMQTLESEEFNISSNYKAVFGDWFIDPAIEYSYQYNNIDNDASVKGAEEFTSRDYLKQNAALARLRMGYETDKWEIVPQVSINYLDRNFLLEDDVENLFPGYGLDIRRKFTRTHRLSFNANYGVQYPDFNNIRGTYSIESSTQVSTGGYPVNIPTKGYSASLRYRNFMIANRTYIFGYLSYNYNDNIITNYSESVDDYILSGFIPAPFSQSFNSSFYLGYELGFVPIRVEPRISYNWSEGFSTNLDEAIPTENSNQSYELELESRWDFPLNVELGVEYGQTKITSDQEDITFVSWEPRAELEYTIGNFRIETDFAYDQAGTRAISSNLYILDIESNYELKGAPLTFKIEANNILNLDPRERVRSSANFNTFSLTRYQVFPGYIIGGVTWQF
jgi:hypothetical protein